MSSSRTRPFAILLLLGAVAGLLFASVSTFDFAQHLDRQVHGLHCSFIPGIIAPDASGTSGCHITLMSPYSSVLRSRLWGGIPVSLPGMGIFAFLVWRALSWLVAGRDDDRAGAQVLVLGSAVPVAATLVMGGLALMVLDAFCKVCAGIYISSFVSAVGAFGVFLRLAPPGEEEQEQLDEDGLPLPALAPRTSFLPMVLALGAYCLVPAVAWAALAPDQGRYVGTCGSLGVSDDPHTVLVPLDGHAGATAAVEILDPLCPSCKGFETRLAASGLGPRLDRKVLLFPLDATCNWMVGTTMHAGACTVSEAILCAGDQGPAVIDWAFAHQDEIRTASEADPEAAARMATAAFPAVRDCIGKPAVRTRLNQGLRWAVKNELPVMTPQLYVDGTRMCDADTDLGLDFALGRMLDRKGGAR